MVCCGQVAKGLARFSSRRAVFLEIDQQQRNRSRRHARSETPRQYCRPRRFQFLLQLCGESLN